MSSARGAAGAVKPKLHNVNSFYAGKNHNAVKAPGAGKHGGLQSLGKTTAVVRRMPPPATLPSLRAESQGQDPNVALVPQGGTGWHKDNATGNAQSLDPSVKSGAGQSGASPGVNSGCAPGSGAGATDLRPTWAKQSNAVETPTQAHTNANATSASTRDFPSLAAATATSNKQSSQTLTDSLRPQKSGSWRSGGSSAVSKNDDEPSNAPQSHSQGGYQTVNAPLRNVERQLPSRYYDGNAAPPPPPTGSFQVPKQTTTAPPSTPNATPVSISTTPTASDDSRPHTQDGAASQGSVSPMTPSVHESNPSPFPSNVAMPPPNYSQPPPNFQPVQQQQAPVQLRGSMSAQSLPNEGAPVHCDPEGMAVSQNDGLGDPGYPSTTQNTIFDETRGVAVGAQSNSAPQQQGQQPNRSNDVRNTSYGRRESFENRDWRDTERNHTMGAPYRYREMGFEETSMRGTETDWHSANAPQYREQNRQWNSMGSGTQDVRQLVDNTPQNAYGRERDEDRQDLEREAAIERSRQKRRVGSHSMSQQSDGESRPTGYGSVRLVGPYDESTGGDWDRISAHEQQIAQQRLVNDDNAMYRQDKVQQPQQRWATRQEDYGNIRGGMRRDECGDSKPEYRMLRRPESKESGELAQQMSQVLIDDEIEDDEDDELQLTKLSRPATKVIKRGTGGPVVDDGMQMSIAPPGSQTSNRTSPSTRGAPPQGASNDKRMPDHRAQAHGHRGKRYDGATNEGSKQGIPNQGRGMAQGGRSVRGEDDNGMGLGTVPTVPPPADNIWEKRAEERESAERERTAAQRDSVHQMRLQQHFPAVGEQPAGMGNYMEDGNDRQDGMGRDGAMPKMRSGKHRNQNWTDEGYGGSGGDGYGNGPEGNNDYYGQEDEEFNGELFRGQREFVNSRVTAHHRSNRGLSLGGGRGGRGSLRGGPYSGMRRGSSMPHQQQSRQPPSSNYGQRQPPQRRPKRHDEEPLQEEDNFANMGEFHVEDTYECMQPMGMSQQQRNEGNCPEGEDYDKNSMPPAEHRAQPVRQQRPQRAPRNPQPLYQPRQPQQQQMPDEYGNRPMGRGGSRMGGRSSRGGSSRRGADPRNTTANQNPPERGKRKKEMNIREEEVGREMRPDDENTMKQRGDNYRRNTGMRRGGSQQPNSHRRGGGGGTQSPSMLHNMSGGEQRGALLKSPVTSEGHEEWATASESSDVADKQRTSKPSRRMGGGASAKYNGGMGPQGERRAPRGSNNGPRRDPGSMGMGGNNSASQANASTRMSSKNVKPASTTSHAAIRSSTAQAPTSQRDEGGVRSESTTMAKREACNKDGLAGVDINNAGVIVIDDRPDEQHGEDSMDNDDFEEVLSKKSKRLRQQQLNEQLEAEERRKQKEKEKQEKRRAKAQSRKTDKKANNSKVERNAPAGETPQVNGVATPLKVECCNGGPAQSKTEAQNTLNTTVWNSTIVKENNARQSSPPLENHPVIPSPIARPTPKTSVTSSNPVAVKKAVEVWTGPDDEQRLTTSRKVSLAILEEANLAAAKKNSSVEFAASFNSPSSRSESAQYDFTFDPSLQDEAQPLPSSKSAAAACTTAHITENVTTCSNRPIAPHPIARTPLAVSRPLPFPASTLDANDLKKRLDKVKDFWPGQQQFSNSLLVSTSENGPIAALVNDKSASVPVAAASSLAHAPNVAKVRPQPQSNDQSSTVVPLKDSTSCASSAACLPPPSPIACIPPGAYLQSLSQVPPPAATLAHYSMIFGEPYNPHSTATSPAQTLMGNGVSVSQAPVSRSRPCSFIEQSQQLFIHPPPSGTTPSSLTWSNGNPQLEMLAGINATPPLSSQQANHRFQYSSQTCSGSAAFNARAAMMNGNGKLLGGPPPHMPPPMHPPHSFIAPPPDFISLQGTALGAVGSQRNSDMSSHNSAAASRNPVGVLGQLPPPHHMQQQMNFPSQSQSGFTMTAQGSFNQAPPMHAFTAPPPPLRYPPVAPSLNDASGLLAAGWTTKPSVNAFPLKYANGGTPATTPIGAPSGRSIPPADRWTVPVGMHPQFANTLVFQSAMTTKESGDVNLERFAPTQRCASAPRASSTDENARASSTSSVTASTNASGGETVDSSAQQKKAAKV